MRNYILCALCLLLFGCHKTYPNKLTPKESEFNSEERMIEIHTSRKKNKVKFDCTASYPKMKPKDSSYSNGILTYDGDWFNMRVNKNHPDSCYIIKFHIKKNDLGEKRKVVFYVQGDIHTKTTGGSITQNAQ